MNINDDNKNYSNNNYSHFVGVKFHSGLRSYFFGFKELDLKLSDKVVVETVRGVEIGEITIEPVLIDNYKSELGLKPVIRKASESDIKQFQNNLKDAKYALQICENEIKNLGLDMRLTSCEYTLDKTKVIFSYLADERVDFRELLKVLASRLHARIELRQIGARDKAKAIGGLGVCGLPLCCSTFLNEFDGISINRAKNQMLTINIPKLSGACGKLFCCLKYEDDTYTELKQSFPELGKKVFIDKQEFTVTSINVISKMVELRNEETAQTIPLDEFYKQTKLTKNKRIENEEK